MSGTSNRVERRAKLSRHVAVVVGLWVLTSCVAVHGAEDRPLAAVLPESTILYVEIRAAGEFLERVLAHPWYALAVERPELKAALAAPQFTQFRAALAFLESRTSLPWDRLVQTVTGRGMAVAVDGNSGGVVIVGRSQDATTLTKLRDALIDLVRLDAQRNGRPDPVKTGEYRGVPAVRVGDLAAAVWDDWFIVTNQTRLGQQIVDRLLDRPNLTLAAKESFQQAIRLRDPGWLVWGYADMEALRTAGVAADLFKGKADDLGGEFLLGGVLSVLPKTPYVVADLSWTSERLAIRGMAPFRADWIDESRYYYFGPQASGAAPPLLVPTGTILSVSFYRDLSQLWLRAGDLVDKETSERLAQADSTLTTLFSGRDFGEDILGAIGPHLQFVVVRQDFSNAAYVPAIELPAVALVAELKDPQTMQRELRRIFQSLIGFLNIVSAMNGQPQLELDEERDGDIHLVFARFLPPHDQTQQKDAPIQFNFSPCLGFAGSRVTVATTSFLARQVLSQCPTAEVAPQANLAVLMDNGALLNILTDNRRHLIAQDMLTRGHSREESEREVETLLSLIKRIDRLQLSVSATDRLTLSLEAFWQHEP